MNILHSHNSCKDYQTPSTLKSESTQKYNIFMLLCILMSFGACEESKLLNNGLTKEVQKVTELFINIEFDSLAGEIYDTISTKEKFYNDHDQLIKSIDKQTSI